MELLEKINAQLEELKEKRKALVSELQKDFPSLIVPLLAESKRIESIGWRQYTPYFNDGDECVFGVNNDYLEVNGVDEDNADFLNEKIWKDGKYENNPDIDQHEVAIFEKIQSVLKSVPDDFYKDLFGDHVRVTIHKDGRIETEEYEHD